MNGSSCVCSPTVSGDISTAGSKCFSKVKSAPRVSSVKLLIIWLKRGLSFENQYICRDIVVVVMLGNVASLLIDTSWQPDDRSIIW
jgi:hypothetical protein